MKKFAFIFLLLTNLNIKSQHGQPVEALATGRSSNSNSTLATCSPSPCSYVSNGDFESASTCYYDIGSYIGCWADLAYSPDIFVRGCNTIPGRRVAYNTFNNQSGAYDPTSSDSYSGPGTGNDKFIGLYAYKLTNGNTVQYQTEAAQTQLGNSLVNGQQYVISFWAKVNNNFWGNGAASNLTAYVDFHSLPGIIPSIYNYNAPLSQCVSSAVQMGTTTTVPNDNTWHYFQQVFTYTGPTGNSGMAISYNSFIGAFTSMSHYDAYVFLDDVSLNQLGGIPIVTNPPPLCNTQTIPNLNAYVSITGGVFSGAGVVNTGGVYSFNPGTLALGNHTVFYTYTSGTCVYHQALVVTIVNGSVSATLANQTVCSANNCTTVAPVVTGTGPFTYTWNLLSTAASVNVCPNATSTYNVQVTNAVGCVATASGIVTVNPTPVVNANNATICVGSSSTLVATGANSYIWTPAASLSCTTCSNPIANPVNTTIYSVVGTTNGCNSATKQVTVTVNPIPVVNASASPATVCAGSLSTLAASGATSYQWSANAGSSTSSSVGVTPNSVTTYVVTGSTAGCSATAQVTVQVNALPVVTVSPTQTICAGEFGTINAGGANSYSWSNSSSLSSPTGSSVIASPVSTTNYVVTGTGLNGCTNTASTNVIVSAKPEIRYALNNPGPDVYKFYTNITGGTSYVWNAYSPAMGTATFSGQGTNTISNVGWSTSCNLNKNMEIVSVNLNGCTAYQYIPYNCDLAGHGVFPIGGPTSVTPGATQTYVIQNGSIALYPSITWLVDGGTIVSGQGTSSVTIQWMKGYRGKLAFYTSNGTLGQNGALDVAICALTPPVNPFAPGGVIFCNTAGNTQLNAGNQGSNYIWSPVTSNSQVITVNANPQGHTDYYYVTIVNGNNCKSTFMQTVVTNVGCRTSGVSSLNKTEAEGFFYPNPAKNSINFQSQDGAPIGHIVITNYLGETVFEKEVNESTAEFDISSLAPGMYVVYSHSAKGKLVKE